MSKRKAPEAPAAGRAAGKRRADPLDADDADDGLAEAMLGADGADLTEVVDNADALADAIGGDGEERDVDDGDCEDDLLAAALGEDDDGQDDDDGGGPESEAPPDGPALPEAGELPDGVSEASLTGDAEVDLSACGELTLAQARRVAECLATNDGLTSVTVGGRELAVGDLREEGELEWDSEEYTDVEAIIFAELLKANTTVERLDLARNQINDAGTTALAAMLATNSTIEYLNLESNTFGERGGTAILDALATNTSVQYLNLMYNGIPTSTQGAIRQAWQTSGRGVGLQL